MHNNFTHLLRLIESIKTAGFFKRLFAWNQIKTQLINAVGDLHSAMTNAENQSNIIIKQEMTLASYLKDLQIASESGVRKDAEIEKLQHSYQENLAKQEKLVAENSAQFSTVKSNEERLQKVTGEYSLLAEKNNNLVAENKKLSEGAATNTQTILELNGRKSGLEIELAEIKKVLQWQQAESNELKKQCAQLLKDDQYKRQEHTSSMATLTKLQDQVHADRTKELEERKAFDMARLTTLKETWSRHEAGVKNSIQGIAERNIIEYIDRVPFKGNPDNTLKICDEFVVFDAKSPGGDSLHNFHAYLSSQAEKAAKYAKQENVKPDIFFVVPSNTLEHLKQFTYRFGDHTVYIISIDTLEPVILSLKKIEDYEFVDQLSPEDRENICRVLGKFAHLSKRRIQVDSFFAKQFIELAYKCETLPPDILKSVIEFERTEKLNPPIEKRAKAIPIIEVETESKNIHNEADGRGILMADSAMTELLNSLPLHKVRED